MTGDWLYLITRGCSYLVDPQGRIARMDQAGFRPSDTWRLIGIEGSRHAFYSLASLQAGAAADLGPMFNRRGEARYHVRDWDHGTLRTWGNPALVEVRMVRTATAQEMLSNRDRAAI